MNHALLTVTRSMFKMPVADERGVTWGFKDIAKLMGLYMLYQFVVQFFLFPIFDLLGIDGNLRSQVNYFTSGWLSLAMVYLTHAHYRFWPDQNYFGLCLHDFRARFKQGAIWGIVLRGGMIVSAFIVVFIAMLFVRIDHSWLHNGPESVLEQVAPWGLPWVLVSIDAVFKAAFTEEFICRGLLYGWLTKRYTVGVGRFVSSLVFAVLHGSILMLIPTFVFGYGMVLLYERTKKLAPCVVAHGVCNLIAVVMAAAMPSFGTAAN